ncbi:hypothetical protein ACWATR_25175 [Nostoc sp. UIC 10890]
MYIFWVDDLQALLDAIACHQYQCSYFLPKKLVKIMGLPPLIKKLVKLT